MGVEERKSRILFLSHCEKQCGVYQFGLNVATVLRQSSLFDFVYAECSNVNEYLDILRRTNPAAVIYNFYPSTMPWLKKGIARSEGVPNIAIFHEVTQAGADLATNHFFDYHIAPDPTLLLKNPIVFKTGRLLLLYKNVNEVPDVPTIGSFGFGTLGKGFEKLITTVQEEYDEAIIKLHIPSAAFADADGASARNIAEKCQSLIKKTGIDLRVSHDFLDQTQLLDFLAKNSVNAFFYEANDGRGISSVIDYALSVQRPVAITSSNMFRHILNAYPSICIENTSIKEIISHGTAPLLQYVNEWTAENLLWDYERIVQAILDRGTGQRPSIITKLSRKFRKKPLVLSRERWSPTLEPGLAAKKIDRSRFDYVPSFEIAGYNRILDDKARALYKPVVELFNEHAAEMLMNKIPEANIQQAFVFDSFFRLTSRINTPRVLCVGSYDDTAAYCLEKMGFAVDEVDPVINYDLETFCTKPTTEYASYDIIFSTSVIEHVRNDEQFVILISRLLAPGGVAIITCDFNDNFKEGDRLPKEDFRLYTRKDFLERILPAIPDCFLVDEPRWDYESPDFTYAGCSYCFASLVFKKKACR